MWNVIHQDYFIFHIKTAKSHINSEIQWFPEKVDIIAFISDVVLWGEKQGEVIHLKFSEI